MHACIKYTYIHHVHAAGGTNMHSLESKMEQMSKLFTEYTSGMFGLDDFLRLAAKIMSILRSSGRTNVV